MRKRMAEPTLKSWEDVNLSLKKIAEAEIEISKIEADMNLKIAAIKEEAERTSKQYKDIIKKEELLAKEYTTTNKCDLNGKSRDMTFGRVGFRLSTKVVLPKVLDRVIESLRRNRMDDCISTKETVNKDILKTYSEDAIIMVGGTLKKEDTFWYEIKKDELAKA